MTEKLKHIIAFHPIRQVALDLYFRSIKEARKHNPELKHWRYAGIKIHGKEEGF